MPHLIQPQTSGPRAPRRRAGFTLIELLLVLAILGVISALAWGSIRSQIPRYKLVRAANGLASDVAELRMTAINTNRETRILVESLDPDPSDPDVNGGSWRLQAGNASAASSSWEDLPVDALDDGVDDEHGENPVSLGSSGSRGTGDVGLTISAPLQGPGPGNRNAVVFSPRGWVTNPSSDFGTTGYITLELLNKAALRRGISDEIHLHIARSGYLRLESLLITDAVSAAVQRRSSDGS